MVGVPTASTPLTVSLEADATLGLVVHILAALSHPEQAKHT